MSKTITLKIMEDFTVLKEFQRYNDTTLTICFLTMKNGIVVTGQSACVDPENYVKEFGEQLAEKDAYDKCWSLFGFQLASDLRGYTMITEEDLK